MKSKIKPIAVSGIGIDGIGKSGYVSEIAKKYSNCIMLDKDKAYRSILVSSLQDNQPWILDYDKIDIKNTPQYELKRFVTYQVCWDLAESFIKQGFATIVDNNFFELFLNHKYEGFFDYINDYWKKKGIDYKVLFFNATNDKFLQRLENRAKNGNGYEKKRAKLLLNDRDRLRVYLKKLKPKFEKEIKEIVNNNTHKCMIIDLTYHKERDPIPEDVHKFLNN